MLATLRGDDVSYGHWEGELLQNLPTVDPVGFSARSTEPWSWQPTDGESYSMLSDRVALWLVRPKNAC